MIRKVGTGFPKDHDLQEGRQTIATGPLLKRCRHDLHAPATPDYFLGVRKSACDDVLLAACAAIEMDSSHLLMAVVYRTIVDLDARPEAEGCSRESWRLPHHVSRETSSPQLLQHLHQGSDAA